MLIVLYIILDLSLDLKHVCIKHMGHLFSGEEVLVKLFILDIIWLYNLSLGRNTNVGSHQIVLGFVFRRGGFGLI